MKVPYSWLSDYVDIDVPIEELADKLLRVGLEVEGIERQGDAISNTVVGKITKIEKNPNSDKLQICQVEVGAENGGTVQIVTAATNVYEGALVPAALVGANLVGGIKIKKAKLRGVESYGMFCSGEELGITDDDYEGASVYGILILKDDAKIGQDIKEYLGLDEIILDIDITANRPDCQSIFGIAREVAAVLDKEVKTPDLSFKTITNENINDYLQVDVMDNETCPKYSACMVKDIKLVESPSWMKKRLKSVGLNSISAFVDITNYVLIELGQPMHAFDANEIIGNKIIVRRAKDGEKLTLFHGLEVELNSNHLVIADAKKANAVAGIMGGENSGVHENTERVIFEAAKFKRDTIRKTSREIGVRSDSSARFEKGIDVYTTNMAMKRALHLVYSLGAGSIMSGKIDVASEVEPNKIIETTVSKINDVLGLNVPAEEMKKSLSLLNFEPKIQNDKLICNIPNYRMDIDGFADIAEEVIRYYGYDHVTGTLLKRASITQGGYSEKQQYIVNLKQKLAYDGYFEAITYSFVTPKFINNLKLEDDKYRNHPVKIKNPLGEEVSVMRTTLIHSMLNSLCLNGKRGNAEAGLFEIANIYISGDKELPKEIPTLCVGEYGADSDFYTIKRAFETAMNGIDLKYELFRSKKQFLHPGRACDVYINGKCVGCFGEIHPNTADVYEVPKHTCVLELDLSSILDNCKYSLKFETFSKFPTVERDLAFVVNEEVSMGSIKKIIKKNGGHLLSDVNIFDVYRGEPLSSKQKSLAFNLKFSSMDKTLKDKEVDKIVRKIIAEVERQLGGVLR